MSDAYYRLKKHRQLQQPTKAQSVVIRHVPPSDLSEGLSLEVPMEVDVHYNNSLIPSLLTNNQDNNNINDSYYSDNLSNLLDSCSLNYDSFVSSLSSQHSLNSSNVDINAEEENELIYTNDNEFSFCDKLRNFVVRFRSNMTIELIDSLLELLRSENHTDLPKTAAGLLHTKSSDDISPVTKADLESFRRSIEYRIREEAKVTRGLITASQSATDIEKILKDDKFIDLPKTNLDSFLNFETVLESDVNLVKKLKCFMVLNINSMSKISENLTAIIPKIMTKDVQLEFSAFGRETFGKKKLNFSGTNTYKYLIEVLLSKHVDVKEKTISSILSRWFSGAKDREGGKKERLSKTNQ